MNLLKKWPIIMADSWIRCLIHEPSKSHYYRLWAKTLFNGRSPLIDEIPWITYEAIEWLESMMKPNIRVFEWGSGGSTLFFANRVQQVTTIEHDFDWYKMVSKKLVHKEITNVDLHLIEPEAQIHPSYRSTNQQYKGLSFQRYVQIIDTFPNNTFDLVVVDGRARLSCIQHSIAKIKPQGFLLLDNSDRDEYKKGNEYFSNWPQRVFYGPVPYAKVPCSTTLWQKPF